MMKKNTLWTIDKILRMMIKKLSAPLEFLSTPPPPKSNLYFSVFRCRSVIWFSVFYVSSSLILAKGSEFKNFNEKKKFRKKQKPFWDRHNNTILRLQTIINIVIVTHKITHVYYEIKLAAFLLNSQFYFFRIRNPFFKVTLEFFFEYLLQ